MSDLQSRVIPATPEACLPSRFRRPRLPPDLAAEYLHEVHGIRISKATLANWRSSGRAGREVAPPLFERAGRAIYYQTAALDAWAVAWIGSPRSSTSDVGL